jgi:DNA-directed RNA polymerase subunit beta
MEVWALEAYGAAHILQELLTCKSMTWRDARKSTKPLSRANRISSREFPNRFKRSCARIAIACLDVELITEDEIDIEEATAGVLELVGAD